MSRSPTPSRGRAWAPAAKTDRQAYKERYEHTRASLGLQLGSKVARVDITRELTPTSGTC